MQGASAEEEGTATEEDGTAAEAADQEEAMLWIEADGGCGAAIREEVAAPKQRGDGGAAAKEGDNHHLLVISGAKPLDQQTSVGLVV